MKLPNNMAGLIIGYFIISTTVDLEIMREEWIQPTLASWLDNYLNKKSINELVTIYFITAKLLKVKMSNVKFLIRVTQYTKNTFLWRDNMDDKNL